jgi:Flp pilus assembly pilin Flp
MNLDMIATYIRARLGLSDEKGQTLVEYALILSLLAIASVLALGFLSGKINAIYSKTGSNI